MNSKDALKRSKAENEKLEILQIPPKIQRISWRSISNQVLAVLNIERGVFYTLKELFFRPRKTVNKHLFENRTLLLNPLRFLVLSTTIASIVTFYYVDFDGFQLNASQDTPISINSSEKVSTDLQFDTYMKDKFGELFQKLLNFSFFFVIPICAFFTWLFLRKRYNYPELLVVHAYQFSMTNCISIVLTPALSQDPIIYLLLTVFMYGYIFFFYTNLIKRRWKGVFLSLLLTFLSLLSLIIISIIITVFTFINIESELFPNCSFF